MKKFLPFVFPALSLLIVVFLAFRWYENRTDRGQVPEFAENVELETLNENENMTAISGVADYETLDMESSDEASMGELRYVVEDGKIKFTVLAGFSSDGDYQVWLKDPDSEATRKAFDLEFKKGGYTGSAAISVEVLPFEVLVSKGELVAGDDSNILLRVLLSRETCGTEDCEINLDELAE